MPRPEAEKMTALALGQKKARGEKIAAVTAYDFPTARLASEAGIDLILVGDSLGMVLQGRENTLKVSMDEMVYHTSMVSRARPRSLVVSDMPYGSFHAGVGPSVENACRCLKEGGAEAVKLEGGRKRFPVIEALLDAEVPVLAHLGLTPQSVHALGGFKVQGKLKEKAREIFQDALDLEKLGVFAVVLESIPMELAGRISAALRIPTIGIGAGPLCDGQVLVLHDLVGLTDLHLPRFVRRYADSRSLWLDALRRFVADVGSGAFPAEKESYHLERDIEEFFR
ncbi:MAG: 3-methyl-2-oxobutanoate hydroxymethyltransferase [Candidatus Aminicenantes bacterium]|nr:3-methyl-2-oxobutanoate hydroxymethyltransferase [Candidatus Aminicenantes bacterium]